MFSAVSLTDRFLSLVTIFRLSHRSGAAFRLVQLGTPYRAHLGNRILLFFSNHLITTALPWSKNTSIAVHSQGDYFSRNRSKFSISSYLVNQFYIHRRYAEKKCFLRSNMSQVINKPREHILADPSVSQSPCADQSSSQTSWHL